MAADSRPSAITPAGLPSALAPIRPARTIDDLCRAYQEAQERGHLLSPIAVADDIPPMHKVALHATVIDPSIPDGKTTGPEVYCDQRYCDRERGEVVLGAAALAKIMRTAGAKIVGSPRRMDDRRDPYYCETEVTLRVRELDGSWSEVTKSAAIDLRDGAPETLKPEWRKEGNRSIKTGALVPLDASALADKRRTIVQTCETKALNRCIRALLVIKRVYTREELARPFWVPVLVQDLDPNRPDERAVLLSQLGGSQAALYGPSSLPRGAQVPVQDEPEPIDVSAMDEESYSVTVDAAPAQLTDSADPWDSPAAAPAKACRLPVPQATLDQVPVHDGLRMEYLSRLNALARGMFAELGAERAKAIISHHAPDFDALTWTLPQIAELGKALRAELQGGGR